jgi:hypothetical protein
MHIRHLILPSIPKLLVNTDLAQKAREAGYLKRYRDESIATL